jgi:hypothetical protein
MGPPKPRKPRRPRGSVVPQSAAAAKRNATRPPPSYTTPTKRQLECALDGPFPLLEEPVELRCNRGIWPACTGFMKIMHQPVVSYMMVSMPWLGWSVLGPYMEHMAFIAEQLQDIVFQETAKHTGSAAAATTAAAAPPQAIQVRNLHCLEAADDFLLACSPHTPVVEAARNLFTAGLSLTTTLNALTVYTNMHIAKILNSLVPSRPREVMARKFRENPLAFDRLFVGPMTSISPGSLIKESSPGASWPPYVRVGKDIYTVADAKPAMNIGEQRHLGLANLATTANGCVRADETVPLTTLKQALRQMLEANRERGRHRTHHVALAAVHVSIRATRVLAAIADAYKTEDAAGAQRTPTALFLASSYRLADIQARLAKVQGYQDTITRLLLRDFPRCAQSLSAVGAAGGPGAAVAAGEEAAPVATPAQYTTEATAGACAAAALAGPPHVGVPQSQNALFADMDDDFECFLQNITGNSMGASWDADALDVDMGTVHLGGSGGGGSRAFGYAQQSYGVSHSDPAFDLQYMLA